MVVRSKCFSVRYRNSSRLSVKYGIHFKYVDSFAGIFRFDLRDKLLVLKKGRKEMFYLTTHSSHFIYGYMASDIW